MPKIPQPLTIRVDMRKPRAQSWFPPSYVCSGITLFSNHSVEAGEWSTLPVACGLPGVPITRTTTHPLQTTSRSFPPINPSHHQPRTDPKSSPSIRNFFAVGRS